MTPADELGLWCLGIVLILVIISFAVYHSGIFPKQYCYRNRSGRRYDEVYPSQPPVRRRRSRWYNSSRHIDNTSKRKSMKKKFS